MKLLAGGPPDCLRPPRSPAAESKLPSCPPPAFPGSDVTPGYYEGIPIIGLGREEGVEG